MPSPTAEKKELAAFGRRVKELRVAAGMTQARLAEQADLAIRNIQRIEAGELNILLTTMVRLANALQVRPGEFFD
jgi:transcriptional regulator with XRE-family HTH domain